MENKIAELKKIKEALEVLINESEKPKFEVGWLKLTGYNVFCYTTDFKSGYGISHKDAWTNKMFIDNLDYWEQAIPSEVQEALTKEAVKRYPIGTKFKSLNGINDRFDGHIMNFKNGILFLSDDYNRLEVFKDGTWATPIKTKTIDELASEFNYYSYNSSNTRLNDFKTYLTENKQTIIETLNNL